MTKRILKNKKALSPVIATVILVAVTIVVAVAVSYWMGGIAGLYTRFEEIKITQCYAVTETNGNYTVNVALKNSGTADATIDEVLVNGKPMEDWGTGNIILNPGLPITIAIGTSQDFTLSINSTLWESGTSLNLVFHSASGKEYPRLLSLP